ncbi:heme exporter protein CcmD [Glaciecola sp. SC05]|uniref:heme exporter protein CcmD n=1 Tax=Glaciecola sp. SC05 TaxID=1987355 RepID=UPI003529548B
MGNRGLFVWLSYGVSIAVMLALLMQSIWFSQSVRKYVYQQQQRAQRILAARAKRKQSKQTAVEGNK